MAELKLDLETLKQVRLHCNLYSDMSSKTLGYRWVCDKIEQIEKEAESNIIPPIMCLCEKPEVRTEAWCIQCEHKMDAIAKRKNDI